MAGGTWMTRCRPTTIRDSVSIMSAPFISAVKLHSTDEQLVHLVMAGDSAAFSDLYDRYVRSCFGLALRMLADQKRAEAVVHDVFAALWDHPDTYSPQSEQFPCWLLRTVHHRCIAELRRKRESEAAFIVAARGHIATLSAGEVVNPEYVTIAEQQRIINEALGQMTSEQREILELAYFAGLSYTQVAEKLSQPLATVYAHACDGLRSLKALLEPTQLLF